MIKKITNYFPKLFILFAIFGYFACTGKIYATGRLDQAWWNDHPNEYYRDGFAQSEDAGLLGKVLSTNDESRDQISSPYIKNWNTGSNYIECGNSTCRNPGEFFGATEITLITGHVLDLNIHGYYCNNNYNCKKIFVLDTDYVILSGSLYGGGTYGHSYDFLGIISKKPGGTTIYTNRPIIFGGTKAINIILDNVHIDGGFSDPSTPRTSKSTHLFYADGVAGQGHAGGFIGNITINNSTISNINGQIMSIGTNGSYKEFGGITINNVTTYNNSTSNNKGLFHFDQQILGNIIFNNLKSFDNLVGQYQYIIYTNNPGVSINNFYFNPGSNNRDIYADNTPIAVNNIVGSIYSTSPNNCYVHNIIGDLASQCQLFGYYKHFDKPNNTIIYDIGDEIGGTTFSNRNPGSVDIINLGCLKWNYIINPFSAINNGKYDWQNSSITTTNGCVTRSNGNTSTISISGQKYSFGKDLPTQVAPVKWNGNRIVYFDIPYDTTKYIASQTTKIDNLVMEGYATPLVSGNAKIKVKRGAAYPLSNIFGPYINGNYQTSPYSPYRTNNISFNPATVGNKYVLAQYTNATDFIHRGQIFSYTGNNQAPAEINGTITINNGAYATNTGILNLTLSATNASHMKFSCNGNNRTNQISYNTTYNLNIANTNGCTTGTGTKTVYVKFINNTNSGIAQDTIIYDNQKPIINVTVGSARGFISVSDDLVGFTGGQNIKYKRSTNGSCPPSLGLYNTTGISYNIGDTYAYTTVNTPQNPGTHYLCIGQGFSDRAGNTSIQTISSGYTINDSEIRGEIIINNGDPGTNSNQLNLSLTATNASHMKFSCNGNNRTSLFTYSGSKIWAMTNGSYGCTATNEEKTIYVSFSSGSKYYTAYDNIYYDTQKPTINFSNAPNNTINITVNDTPSNGLGLQRFATIFYKRGNSNNCPTNQNEYIELPLQNQYEGEYTLTGTVPLPTNQGEYYLCILSGIYDRAGNASNTTFTGPIVISGGGWGGGGKIMQPSCTPDNACFSGSTSLISCSSTNNIKYTTNGSNPNCSSSQTWHNQTFSSTTTLKVIACSGNQASATKTYTYTKDTVGPNTPTLSSPASNSTITSTSTTLTWNSTTDSGCSTVSGYQAQLCKNSTCTNLASGKITTSTSWNLTNLSSGQYYRRVRAQDRLGNRGSWSSIRSFTVQINTPTPQDPLNPPTCTPNNACFSGNITVSCQLETDNESFVFSNIRTIRYTTNGSNPNCSSSPIWDNQTFSSTTTLKVIACNGDQASAIKTYTYTKDTAGPNAPTLTNPSNGSGVNTLTPTLSWDNVTNDNGCSSVAGYEIRLCINSSCSSPTQSTTTTNTNWTVGNNLTNGNTYYRKVRTKDALGNRGSWSSIRSFTVQINTPTPQDPLNPPTCTPDTACFSGNITVSCKLETNDKSSSFSNTKIRYTTNGTTPNCSSSSEWTSDKTFSSTTTLKVIACNGNQESEIATYEYTKDTIAPSTTASGVPSERVGNDVTVSLNAGDNGCNSTNTTYYCVDTTNTCTPNTQGTSVNVQCETNNSCKKYVRYYSRDGFGNTETVKNTEQIKIDKKNPTITITNPNDTCTTGKIIYANITDEDAGVDKRLYTKTARNVCNALTTNNWTTYSDNSNITLTTDDEGKYICFKAIDKVGNTQYKLSNKITGIDETGPTFTFNDNVGNECETGSLSITNANDTGCAGGLANNAYRFGNGSRGTTTNYTISAQQPGAITVTGYVMDNLGNITSKTAKYNFKNVKPTANDFSTGNIGKNARNITLAQFIAASNATEGDCGTSALSYYSVKQNGDKGNCTINNETLKYTPSSGQIGSDTCIITIKDNENSQKNVTVTFNDIDTAGPSVTIISNAVQCQTGGIIYTITGTYSETVNSVDTGDLALTNASVVSFKKISDTVYVWTVKATTDSYGTAKASIGANTAIDTAGNNNTASNEITWTYDNAGPTFTFSNEEVNECTVGNLSITNVDQIGCAGPNTNQYSFDSNSWNNTSTWQFSNNNRGPGTGTYTAYVRDSLGNITSHTATYKILDTLPTLTYNTKIYPHVISGSKLLYNNLISEMGAKDGECGASQISKTGNITCSTGSATWSGNGIYVTPPSENNKSEISCTVKFADNEGNIVTGTVKYTGDTKAPTIAITGPDTACLTGKTISATIDDNYGQMFYHTGKNSTCNDSLNFINYQKNTPINFNKESDTGTYVCFKAVDQYGNTRFKTGSMINNIDKTAPSFELTGMYEVYECENATIQIVNYNDTGCANTGNTPYKFNNTPRQNSNKFTQTSNYVSSENISIQVKDELGNISTQSKTLIWNNKRISFSGENSKNITIPDMYEQRSGNLTRLENEFSLTGWGDCERITLLTGNCTHAEQRIENNTLIITPNDNTNTGGQCSIGFTDGDTTITGTISFNVKTKLYYTVVNYDPQIYSSGNVKLDNNTDTGSLDTGKLHLFISGSNNNINNNYYNINIGQIIASQNSSSWPTLSNVILNISDINIEEIDNDFNGQCISDKFMIGIDTGFAFDPAGNPSKKAEVKTNYFYISDNYITASGMTSNGITINKAKSTLENSGAKLTIYSNHELHTGTQSIICKTGASCPSFSCNSTGIISGLTLETPEQLDLYLSGTKYTAPFKYKYTLQIDPIQTNENLITGEWLGCIIQLNDSCSRQMTVNLKLKSFPIKAGIGGQETYRESTIKEALDSGSGDNGFFFFITNPQQLNNSGILGNMSYEINFSTGVADEFYYITGSAIINGYKEELLIKRPTYNYSNPKSYLFNFPEYQN